MYKRERFLEDLNLEEAREFLEEIYRTTNGNILIVVLDKSKDRVVKSYAVDDVTSIDFAELAEYNKQGYDIYYGINTRRGSGNFKDDVFEVCELFADVDPKDFEGGKEEAYDFINKVIQQYDLVPTYIIDSGHGYHIHFVLKVPIPIEHTGDILKIVEGVFFGKVV